MNQAPLVVRGRTLSNIQEEAMGTNMGKNYAVRLKCPYGDEDMWMILQNREETLKQILSTPWDFECPVHGVQREIPIEASDEGLPLGPRPQRKGPTEPGEVKVGQRLSKRLSLRVPVMVYGWARDQGTFHEGTAMLLVNAGGGLLPLAAKIGLGETILLVNKSTREEQACRVAYVGPEVAGESRVGIAFKRPAPSFWKVSRPEYRVPKALRVRVRGMDHNRNPFVQNAQTVDISQHGARLDGVGYLTGPGQTIEVKRRWRKARFRVVWTGQIGTPQANQIGICSLEPSKCIWGVPLPQSAAAKAEAVPALSFAPSWTGEDRPQEQSAERRRKPRLTLLIDRQVPVAVRWNAPDGTRREEKAIALVVNEFACVLPMKAAMIEGMVLELVNQSSKKVGQGKVAWCGAVDPEGRHRVAIELEKADPQFWSGKST